MSLADERDQSPESSLISAARQEAAGLAKAAEAPELPTDAIPGFTIVRRLGRGGMGAVYQARQKEPPRDVALKVMRSGGLLNREHLALFRQEIETLARFNHPNIAAIYGTGRTDNGRHFFVMELVRGVRLTEYARLEQLALREQLQLFRQVCEAVQYAHQSGVVHRDLKPSNIMVDANGNPKVVDFGLAWIEDADGPIHRLSADMGTWPYMSPEQASGRTDVISRFATDVYSLGVVLYELLTKRPPYELTAAKPEEARRIICETIPPKPSTHRPALRGDLDFILMRALAKDPADRYPTPAALSDDIERYLTHQPVLAHPQNAAYQLGKLVVRYKVAFTFLVVVFALIVSFGVWMSVMYAEAHAARNEVKEQKRVVNVALARARRAEARVASQLESSAHSLMQEGNFAAAEPVLRECLSIREDALDDDHWLAAHTQSLLGGCLTELGQYQEAEELLLGSYPAIQAGRTEQHERTREAAGRIINLYLRWAKPEKAAEWQAKLEPPSDDTDTADVEPRAP